MRVVKLRIREECRDSVLSVLEEEEIDYLLVRERSAGAGDDSSKLLVEFPLPDQAVEYVRNRLHDVGVEEDYIVTVSAESAQTEQFEALEERFVTGTEEGDSISSSELRTTALDLHPDPFPYYAMTLISALVAVAGLLLDSAALVVGAMVIAPQVGSALIVSVGATIGDWQMLKRGVRAQVLSLSFAMIGAAVFGIALQAIGVVSPIIHPEEIAQIGERVSPELLALAVGIAAGAAGAFGIATALPVSIVGVMIAAALIPAAAATGIGLAWNVPSIAVGAFVLLVANLITVNVAGLATLRSFGYRSVESEQSQPPTVGVLLLGLVLVSAIVFAGVAFTTQATFENEVNEAINGVLDDEDYEDLELVRTRTDFVYVPGANSPTVKVVVHRPADRPYPHLAENLGEAVSTATNREVIVQVEFRERQEHRSESRN